MPARRDRGFTLIELLVVILIIGIILAMIGLKVGGEDGAEAEQESRRLALLVQAAQQDAIMQGDILALELKNDGYQFLRLDDKQKFQPLAGDDVLHPREMPAGVAIESVDVEGMKPGEKDGPPGVILWPTGEQSAFGVTFVQGKVRWRVEGTTNGEVKYTRVA